MEGTNGNFYGTTEYGGAGQCYGTVFAVSSGGILTNLDFFDLAYEGFPVAGLVLDTNGYFYGSTLSDELFQMAGDGTLTVLYNISWHPGCQSTLLIGSDGDLYGTVAGGGAFCHGWVFCMTTNADFATVYSFTGGEDGAAPWGPLIQGSDGALYGATPSGGAHGFGTIFRLTTNGTLSVLYSFGTVTNWDGSARNGAQANGLLLGNDGNFYGTTASGGCNGKGTVFRLTPCGALTTLVYFDGTNGANPEAALVQGNDGYYYGTTANGGNSNAGTVFKLSVPSGLTALGQSNGMVCFSCSALVGQTYQMQFTSSLSPPVWQNVGGPIPASSPCLTFTNAIVAEQAFYRIVQLQDN